MSHPLVGGKLVRLCYCDESGTGDEPIATMAGIVVDASRMHLTKGHWLELLASLSAGVGRQVVELHTRDFYAGNGVFRGTDGKARTRLITDIFRWIHDRKHRIVYAAVSKASYFEACRNQDIPAELNTVWRFMGYHLILAMQKHCQRESGVKGHTIFIFDNEEREKVRFTDLIARPPAWSDTYYDRRTNQGALDHIVDVPYFGDSKDVPLIQLADVISFFIRRYAEIAEGVAGERYDGEGDNLTSWMADIVLRSIGTQYIYPRRGRDYSAELFYRHAPASVRGA